MAKIENVEEYLKAHSQWEKELTVLRNLLCSYPFEETIKWGGPVYVLNGRNLIGIGAFKNHYALWLFQGTLLKENTNLLHNAQEGKTKTLRQVRFNKDSKIEAEVLKKYIEEAINLSKTKVVNKAEKPQKTIIPGNV